ncbi:MAG: hypothetical protein OXH22_09460 [Chloroflexi bacterium]|nr:hypothetical protein [Chloroflexota bacterium]MYC07542.1 hypothetical protein [Chloroflexota bacterium]
MTVKAHANEQHAVEMMKHLSIYSEHNVEPAPPAAPKVREIRLPGAIPSFRRELSLADTSCAAGR